MNKKFNFVVFPYRGLSFFYKYGSAVRDLQMLMALAENSNVISISVIDRPLSIYEKIVNLFKSRGVKRTIPNKIRWIRGNNFDLIGPLRGRLWAAECYSIYEIDNLLSKLYDADAVNVILDYTPIAPINEFCRKHNEGGWIYWYDLIDSFNKHNRFSDSEKKIVSKKYKLVAGVADYITAVSSGAANISNRAIVLSNAVGIKRHDFAEDIEKSNSELFDFGFIGFVTDKFDVLLVRLLSEMGCRIAIYGDFYDKRIKIELSKIPKVSLFGRFKNENLPVILKSFRVGLIPYLKDKLHDESPLKLYQYLWYGKPVLSSVDYEIKDRYIYIYETSNVAKLTDECKFLIKASKDRLVKERMRNLISNDDFWDVKISHCLNAIARIKENYD